MWVHFPGCGHNLSGGVCVWDMPARACAISQACVGGCVDSGIPSIIKHTTPDMSEAISFIYLHTVKLLGAPFHHSAVISLGYTQHSFCHVNTGSSTLIECSCTVHYYTSFLHNSLL